MESHCHAQQKTLMRLYADCAKDDKPAMMFAPLE